MKDFYVYDDPFRISNNYLPRRLYWLKVTLLDNKFAISFFDYNQAVEDNYRSMLIPYSTLGVIFKSLEKNKLVLPKPRLSLTAFSFNWENMLREDGKFYPLQSHLDYTNYYTLYSVDSAMLVYNNQELFLFNGTSCRRLTISRDNLLAILITVSDNM